ncbi:MAG: DUF2911 domain-containing protein [Gemmatimonadetes bacterium]|nr:DUF2911 domain-containing protein [Gemmatimonadota bacterium]
MRSLMTGVAAAGLMLVAIQAAPAQEAPAAKAAAVHCTPSGRMALEGRRSPYDSTSVVIGKTEAKVCYGRPSARGRIMIGGAAVPYGKLWRTGANEPTIIHLPVAAEIAGIAVQPGSYSLYTVPGEAEWVVIVNRSTSQWGHESNYTPEVQAQEVGRARVKSERLDGHVETFTITAAPAGKDRSEVVLEWERTRVRIPVQRKGG